MTIWSKHIACWIIKARYTHSEYVIRISFPRQKMVARTRLNVMLYLHCLNTSSNNDIKTKSKQNVYQQEGQ